MIIMSAVGGMVFNATFNNISVRSLTVLVEFIITYAISAYHH